VSLRITTTSARNAELAQYRRNLTDLLASAVEAMPTLSCKHRGGADLPACPRCARRNAVRAAADVVRETGGVEP